MKQFLTIVFLLIVMVGYTQPFAYKAKVEYKSGYQSIKSIKNANKSIWYNSTKTGKSYKTGLQSRKQNCSKYALIYRAKEISKRVNK